MAYAITYNGIEGQGGLYARVQRRFDGRFWDEASLLWAAAEAASCNVPLVETIGIPGEYAGSAAFDPAKGGVYAVAVYSAAGALIHRTEDTYLADQMTALQIINEVQRQLRLPQSPLVTDPHAQLLLSFINEVMLDYMMEYIAWDELKVVGAFAVAAGVPVCRIAPINRGKVDVIRNLQIGTAGPLVKLNDEQFRAYRRGNPGQGQPIYYRQYGRAAGALIIELAPVPDAAYQIDYEILHKPEKLSGKDDVPILDQDTIILGVKYLAKKDQGDDVTGELAAFQAKLGLQGGTQGESNSGDVDFL